MQDVKVKDRDDDETIRVDARGIQAEAVDVETQVLGRESNGNSWSIDTGSKEAERRQALSSE